MNLFFAKTFSQNVTQGWFYFQISLRYIRVLAIALVNYISEKKKSQIHTSIESLQN